MGADDRIALPPEATEITRRLNGPLGGGEEMNDDRDATGGDFGVLVHVVELLKHAARGWL